MAVGEWRGFDGSSYNNQSVGFFGCGGCCCCFHLKTDGEKAMSKKMLQKLPLKQFISLTKLRTKNSTHDISIDVKNLAKPAAHKSMHLEEL